ncbi:lipoprotein insertase outer membrane protein LolB [Thiohalospira sp.]|uniref:lipoprotein insertase outer membrane protein LolB n=1 Tax=Thiohalospira sp. TaxID=3080549 RepID=UPI00397F21D6
MPHPFRSLLAVSGLVLLLLTGCATAPEPESVDDREAAWERHRLLVSGARDWELDGRVAIRAREEGSRASLAWEQRGERWRVSLSGPFGSGEVVLRGGPDGAVLEGPEETHFDTNARALLYRQTGLILPVAALEYWVRGLPAPGRVRDRELDKRGRLAALTQRGWEVRYTSYGEHGGYSLPEGLTATRRDEAVRLRLAIHDWRFPEAGGDGD